MIEVDRNRRSLLKFLAGLGLGAGFAEVYERVYDIPLLERMFRDEINYWVNEYNSARESLDKLIRQYNSTKESLNECIDKYTSMEEAIYKIDELERESCSAISLYQEKMEEAIRRLRNTIEKYRVIVGDERVSLESSTLKVLEDLKITKEKLLKVLPYFPLIKNLSWRPTRIVNDKIYSLNVSLEVISPLNTLTEVEVKLIPVEYDYFITDYGMRREDYHLAFPPEEIREARLNPRGLEREVFNIEFRDIIGGREYEVLVLVRDSAGNEKIEKIKTPYIRQYENIAPLDDITVVVPYYL